MQGVFFKNFLENTRSKNKLVTVVAPLNMRTRYYTTRLHVGAFYLPAFLEEMLREVEEK